MRKFKDYIQENSMFDTAYKDLDTMLKKSSKLSMQTIVKQIQQKSYNLDEVGFIEINIYGDITSIVADGIVHSFKVEILKGYGHIITWVVDQYISDLWTSHKAKLEKAPKNENVEALKSKELKKYVKLLKKTFPDVPIDYSYYFNQSVDL